MDCVLLTLLDSVRSKILCEARILRSASAKGWDGGWKRSRVNNDELESKGMRLLIFMSKYPKHAGKKI